MRFRLYGIFLWVYPIIKNFPTINLRFQAGYISKNNKLIAEYALEKRLFIPYESIPDKVINSFLSAEDKNFFNHPGIDAKGILRAIVNNLRI